MRQSQEVQLNFYELTPSQYGKLHNPPLSDAAVRNRCKQGLIDAYQTEGGHWIIKIPLSGSVTQKEYEQLKQENAELKTIIEAMKKLLYAG